MFSESTLTAIYGMIAALAAALVLLRVVKRLRSRLKHRSAIAGVPSGPQAVARTPQHVAAVSWADRRLFADEESAEDGSIPRLEPDEIPLADDRDLVLGPLTPAFAAMLPETGDRRRRWKRDLRAAGYLGPRAWQNFAAVRYLCVALPMLLLGVMLVLVPPGFELPVAVGLLIVPLLGWALPALRVRARAVERTGEIERGMPDLVDMLNMCVSQGLTLAAALRRIRRQIGEPYPALATELGIIIEQAEVGSLGQALWNFADRIDVPEVHSLVNLLIQTDRMGTSVSDALRTHADGVRETLRQRADEQANRASFRLLFPTVLYLMPAVYFVLLGPAVIELNRFFGDEGGRSLIEAGRNATREFERPTDDLL